MTEKERIAERLRRLKILATQGVNTGERDAGLRLFGIMRCCHDGF